MPGQLMRSGGCKSQPPPPPPPPPTNPKRRKAKPASKDKIGSKTKRKAVEKTETNTDQDDGDISEEEAPVRKRPRTKYPPKERPFDKLRLALRLFQPKANQKQLIKAAKLHGTTKAPEM